jgi:AraC-like DNA-binding protein
LLIITNGGYILLRKSININLKAKGNIWVKYKIVEGVILFTALYAIFVEAIRNMPGNMNMHTLLPSAPLRPFIRTYLVIESEGTFVNRILPDTSLVIAFRFKGQTNYVGDRAMDALPMSVVSGLRKSARRVSYAKDTGNILVLFKEAGASAFFKEPLHELFELSLSLDHFVAKQKIADVEEQLAGAINNEQRIAVVEQFLLSELYGPKPDQLILTAIQNIHTAKGIIKIKDLANTLYISHDAFEKRFRKITGTSPKQFAAIVRMKSITSQRQRNLLLSDLAYDAGYFDQPHFNKDFKLFTGQTPTDFFNAPPLW